MGIIQIKNTGIQEYKEIILNYVLRISSGWLFTIGIGFGESINLNRAFWN